jgi:hypothetical protein
MFYLLAGKFTPPGYWPNKKVRNHFTKFNTDNLAVTWFKTFCNSVKIGVKFYTCQHRSETYLNLPDWNPRFCRVLADVFVQDQRPRFFLLPMEAECDQGPEDLIKICFDNLPADAAPTTR